MRTFQLTRVFPRMSVLDNLLVAGCALGLSPATRPSSAHELSRRAVAGARACDLDAGHLSGGQLKLLEFGCCFMVPPWIALLDEPFAAMHPTMKEIMAGFIRRRHAQGQTFMIVSHDMPVIVELCPRTVCMNAGAVIADESTRAVLSDPVVIEAYLGEARGRMTALLQLRDVTAGYVGDIDILRKVDVVRRRRRHHRADRPQRRRQVDHHEDDLRLPAAEIRRHQLRRRGHHRHRRRTP